MRFINKIFNFIKNRGVSDSHVEENHLTSLLNIISFLSFLGAFSVFLISFYYQDYVYTAITLYITIYFLLIPVLHHFTSIENARLFYGVMTPFWYCGAQLLVGGYFGQDIAAGGTALIVYLIYKEQVPLRNKLLLFNFLLFTLTSLYISFYEPLLGTFEYPLDELMVAYICIGWISIIFFFYDSKLNNIIETLKTKNVELTQKTSELKQFNFIASHDLKNPLTNIINFAGLLKLQDPDNFNEYLSFIKSNAALMNNLIEGVVEVSNTDYVSSPKEVVELNLNTIAKLVVGNMEEEIQLKKAIVKFDSLPQILGDANDFLSVFQKLIHNGIKFNQSAIPTININATFQEDFFKIHFKDNGIGIQHEYHQQIFGFFKKLHNQTKYTGAGLGLSLCQKIILKYKGTIDLESTPNKSSTFSLVLPNDLLVSSQNK